MAKKQQVRSKKHIPLRTCIICREKCDKRQLTRIVCAPEGGVAVDFTGKKNGRGAYLCQKLNCWEKAVSTHHLGQALKTEVSQTEKDGIWDNRPS